jgi:hypothetical protein
MKPAMPRAFILVSCSAYYSTLMKEMTYFSETSVGFKLTARRYIPENSTLVAIAVRTSNPIF